MLKECLYEFNGKKYTFDSIWSALNETELSELNSMSDVLYSKYPKKEAQIKKLESLKAKAKEDSSQLNYLINGDVAFNGENKEIAISTFITQSPEAITNGRPIVEQFNLEEYKQSEIKHKTTELHIPQEQAIREVEKEISNWKSIAEDSKDIHKLLTDPILAVPEDRKEEYIQRAKGNLNPSSKLYNDELLGSLYDSLRTFYKKSKGNYSESVTVRNINLTSTLKNSDTKLFGHIDYAYVDNYGTLHVYNFKVTSKPVNQWPKSKKESYKYEMAFLKQMLANNGVDIKNIDMNIVPLQIQYDADYNEIQGLIVRDPKNQDFNINNSYVGTNYDNTARFFIDNNTQVENISEESLKEADVIIGAAFPFFNSKSDIIGKTVDDLIRKAPTVGETEPLIIREEQPGQWKVIINGKPYEISEPTKKENNKEIKALVLKHINSLDYQNSYIPKIRTQLITGYRNGFINTEELKRNTTFFTTEFNQYIHKYKEDGHQDYELIDDLAECNIIMFRNKQSGIIDVISLSAQDLDIVPKYAKGGKNLLGTYLRDGQTDMMYGDMGAIEAMRTLILLNQIVKKIPNAKFGTLKVLSQFGDKKIYDIEHTSEKYLKEVFKVIRREVRDLPEISYNFTKNNFSDPVDNILREYNAILENNSQSYGKFFSETIGLESLESADNKNAKRKALLDVAKSIQGFFGKNDDIERIARDKYSDPRSRDLARLYLMVMDAYLNYSDENLEYNEPLSSMHVNITTAPTVPSHNVRIVANNLQTTLDSIAENIEEEYTKNMRKFLMDFYKESGYTTLENVTIGDQNRLFKNMYQRDSSGNRLMIFKNPYLNEGDTNYLTNAERKFLKNALFEFNRIRYIKRKDIKQFTSPNDPEIAKYISDNPNGERYLWVPLKRASKTSQRQDIKAYLNNFKRKLGYVTSLLQFDSKKAFDEMVNNLTPEERQIIDQNINELSVHNPMIEWEKDSISRQDRINKLGVDYFETNVEDLLLNFLARSVETEKFQDFLVGTKMIMLKMDLMGGDSIKKELDYIDDYLKVNVFQKSIMESSSQAIVSFMSPVRQLVTYANLAGNMVAYLRDIENGFLENYLRTFTNFQTNISAKNVTKAYEYVVTHGTSNTMNITMLSKLCVRYRLSNTDLARITERLKTNRGGIFNWDNWAFSTLRSPDFLNRMTLFVAKAMQDGCFDAWYIENDELKYNWKKDKRFEIYAKGDKSNPEYAKQKGLYIMKIQEYNQDHPDLKPLEYSDDLPTPYSNQDILAIKNVADNIYGSYDRSLRAMGENKALGWAFGMYTTWMNGMWNNWFLKPGTYNVHQQKVVIEKNDEGEELWQDEHGMQLVQKIDENGNKKYIYEDTGEEGVPNCPIYKKEPVIVQGIIYTFKDLFKIMNNEGKQAALDYIRGDEVARKNILHGVSTALIALLHLMLLKLVLEKAYKEHKKHANEYSVATNILAELGYKSFRQAGDSFRTIYNIVDYVGDSNPPMYKVPTKLIGDGLKFVLGKKSFNQLITGNFAIARAYKDTAKIYENSNK